MCYCVALAAFTVASLRIDEGFLIWIFVNGPGEAREADYGVAGGRGVGILFKKGQVVKKVNDEDLLGELIKLIDEDYGSAGEKNENS